MKFASIQGIHDSNRIPHIRYVPPQTLIQIRRPTFCVLFLERFQQNLSMRRHDNAGFAMRRILAAPETRDGLLLRIELQPGLAVEGAGPAPGDTLLVPGEGKHGQRHGDGDVDPDLTGLEILLEARGAGTGTGEDGRSVAVWVLVDHVDGVVQGVDIQADQYGSEDLLLVAGHVGGDIGDDGGSNLWRDVS